MIRRITPEEQALVREWSLAGIGLAEQARRLGRPVSTLMHTYRGLQVAGLIPVGPATRGPDWTPLDLERLERLIELGYSYDAIGRRLGRSRNAVVIKAKRRGVGLLRTTQAMTAGEVARLLGIGCSKTITRWIGDGWLKARNGGQSDHPIWRIQHLDLLTFLECSDYWMAWEPAQITDPGIRGWTEELRRGQPRWLTPGEAGQRCGVSARAVYRWIAMGYMPSKRYGNHWILESDLEGWVLPCERSRVGIPRAAGRQVVGKEQLVAKGVAL